jgi:hypothetical protein
VARAGTMKPPHVLPPPVKSAAFISGHSVAALPYFFSLASLPTPVRDRLWCCGVVSGEAALLPWQLPLCSPTPDLLRCDASPSASLGLRKVGVFFLRLPRVGWSGLDLHPLRPELLPLRRLGFFFSVLCSLVPPTTTAR